MQERLFGLTHTDLIQLYPNHWVHHNAVNAVKSLQTEAAMAGFDLRLASSYRSFERQLSIWNEKYTGKRPLFDTKGTLLNVSSMNSLERIHAICTYTAIPGTSRHHWGTDFDIYDAKSISRDKLQLISEEYAQGGPCSALIDWLVSSRTHEFTLPYTPPSQLKVAYEPWHISFQPQAQHFIAQLTPDSWLNTVTHLPFKLSGFNTIKNNIVTLFNDYVLSSNKT